MLRGLGDAADARMTFETGRADELAGLRSLLLDKTKVDTQERLAKRGERLDEDAFVRKLDAERYAADKQEQARFWSTLLGIL